MLCAVQYSRFLTIKSYLNAPLIMCYLSLSELLSEAESVEVWWGKRDLDLVYSSMEVLHLSLQTQHVLKKDTGTFSRSN